MASAFIAALDIVSLLLFFCYSDRHIQPSVVESLMCLGGSLWLGWLLSRQSRRTARLLELVGNEPWQTGWPSMWNGAVLYWCVRTRTIRSSFGSLVYVGESTCMLRRTMEHIFRLLRPNGATQQPFFEFIRHASSDPYLIKCLLCEWIFLPVRAAPVDAGWHTKK